MCASSSPSNRTWSIKIRMKRVLHNPKSICKFLVSRPFSSTTGPERILHRALARVRQLNISTKQSVSHTFSLLLGV